MQLNFKDLVFESDEMTRVKRATIEIGAYDLSVIQELNNPSYEIAIFDADFLPKKIEDAHRTRT